MVDTKQSHRNLLFSSRDLGPEILIAKGLRGTPEDFGGQAELGLVGAEGGEAAGDVGEVVGAVAVVAAAAAVGGVAGGAMYESLLV